MYSSCEADEAFCLMLQDTATMLSRALSSLDSLVLLVDYRPAIQATKGQLEKYNYLALVEYI